MAAEKEKKVSTKRLEIDKTNARLILIVGICAFVAVFCMVAIKSLLEQRAYQSKVSAQKEVALKQLNDNIQAISQLEASYKEFAAAPENLLGGDPNGQGERDGDNPRLVLDALPGSYDFPALTTSIENLLKQGNFKLSGINGTDDELTQANATQSGSPAPVEIPFSAEVKTPPASAKTMVELFERSVRPFQIKKIVITGEENNILVTLDGVTYFQPSKGLNVVKEVVR